MLDREYERVITDNTENNAEMRMNVVIIRRESCRQTDIYSQDGTSVEADLTRHGKCEGDNRNESGTTIQI